MGKFCDHAAGISVTRRGFVKAAAALSGAAALYGCSKDDGGDIIYGGISGGSVQESPDAPAITEEVFAGSSPHNCGGGCIIKAYVKNGVIKRFATDETPERTYLDPIPGDYMQERACPRCRSQKSWIYGSNRLMYPLIQTGERGDLNGFKRITWAQAAAYFKAKAEKVMDKFGPGAFHSLYASGMGGGYSPDPMSFAGATGGNRLKYRQDYSFPQWEHIMSCVHDVGTQPKSNDFNDVFNSDELVIWGYNLSEMLNQQQINFQLAQIKAIKENGTKKIGKITVIDPKYTNTAILGADEFVAPVQGTDTAMICGMLHYMMTDCLPELGKMYAAHAALTAADKAVLNAGPGHADFAAVLRRAVGKYVYGFFDTDAADDVYGTNDSYMFDAGSAEQTLFKQKAKVAPGTSLSAYIFGANDYLVTNGYNKASSVYPQEIGYNVRSYSVDGDGGDPLKDKFTKCYGQEEKTPEWAAAICGVPADVIKSLTKRFLTKNISCWIMGGLQRNSEGDQVCWLWPVAMNVFLCFGKSGRTYGRSDGRGNNRRKSLTESWKTNIDQNSIVAAKVKDEFKKSAGGYLSEDKNSWADDLGEISLLTFPNNWNSVNPYNCRKTIPVFTWLDACEATNSPAVNDERWKIVNGVPEKEIVSVHPSRWNDGQIKRLPVPLKFIWHCGGNINVNQNGDCNLAVKVLTSKDDSLRDSSPSGIDGVQMNPYGYKIEFIGMIEVVMTSSCRYADLVLPGSISFERYQTHPSGRSPLTSVTTKAVLPPGDAKVELEIGAELADAFGLREAFYGNRAPAANMTFEENVWLTKLNDPVNVAKFGMDASGWKARGFHKTIDNLADFNVLPLHVPYKAYLANPGPDVRPVKSGGGRTVDDINTCFYTLSGRIEAYCLPIAENYEFRMGNNIDERINLAEPVQGNSEGIYTKLAEARETNGETGILKKGRFCYPIPMYIPLIEGRHADSADDSTDSHPDPLGLKTAYPFNLLTWHTIYRSHSTFNSSPLLNEVKYYKRNSKGEQTYISRKITNAKAGTDNNDLKDSDVSAPLVWTDDVYETVWMNPKTAAQAGVAENDVIIVESPRGKVAGSAHLSNRVRYGTVSMTQGSWYDPIENWKAPSGNVYDKVDVGGNANTLFGLRPSRISTGMTLASECRVKVYKA